MLPAENTIQKQIRIFCQQYDNTLVNQYELFSIVVFLIVSKNTHALSGNINVSAGMCASSLVLTLHRSIHFILIHPNSIAFAFVSVTRYLRIRRLPYTIYSKPAYVCMCVCTVRRHVCTLLYRICQNSMYVRPTSDDTRNPELKWMTDDTYREHTQFTLKNEMHTHCVR